MRKNILVTGGAGYIGSHTVLELAKLNYNVIILDNLEYGHKDIVENVLKVKLIVGDIGDRKLLEEVFTNNSIDAVMHFSAYTYVGESVENPAKYYNNNIAKTLNLLECMKDFSIKKFVFSSTCATYGTPDFIPLTEEHRLNPINPYGFTKMAVEKMLQDFDSAYGIKSVIFRYFNAAGADISGDLGEDHQPETHLIPLVLYTALGKKDSISVFGTDYATPDGTCIRDYIHVTDLAQAHILGLEYLFRVNRSNIFNLGNGAGYSVLEIIECAQKVTGRNIKIEYGLRRAGDPPVLVGDSKKAKEILGWQPQFSEIKIILEHAWEWHKKRHCI